MRLFARILWIVTALVLCAPPGAAAERMYDRDVKKLIDRACGQLDRFNGGMSSQARSAKVTRDGVETDISDFMQDWVTEGKTLRNRFGPNGVAAPETVAFLRRGKAVEGFVGRHPGFTGGGNEWTALRGSLVQLAGAYHLDWSADPASWRPKRTSDSDINALAAGLDAQIKNAGKALDKAAQDANLSSADRKEIDASVKSLRGSSQSFRKGWSGHKPVSSQLDGLRSQTRALSDRAAALGIADAAKGGLAPLQSSLDKLATAFGLS
jgi:hypothetical protein